MCLLMGGEFGFRGEGGRKGGEGGVIYVCTRASVSFILFS